MTKEEAIKLIEHIGIAFVPTDQYGDYDDPEPYEEALDMAIEALQNLSKPINGLQGSDLISRQDAIDTVEELNRKVNDGREFDTICTSDVLRRINALPSAEAVHGEWVDDGCVEKCNQCGERRGFPHWNFCPNCGAIMKGGAK